MTGIDFLKLKNSQLQKLTAELDPLLHYHGVKHTEHDVLPAAKTIGKGEGISSEEMLVLLTAALLHDIGYLVRYKNNEPVAAEMAKEILPVHGFSQKQINIVENLILATRMPQQPENLLEKILCDADLSTLGREDFFISSMQLWRETCLFGGYVDLDTWLRRQYKFLAEHKYFTDSAQKTFSPGKEINIDEFSSIYGKTTLKPVTQREQ